MYIKDILEDKKELIINIPLTTTSWKTRIKTRSSFYDYGIPHASKTNNFTQSNYVEWQIWYDAEVKNEEKINLTTLKNINFIAYNWKEKALYELSEYLYYFYTWWIITKKDLLELKLYLNSITNENLIDSNKDCLIYRSHPTQKTINWIDFYKSEVVYPLLVHKFWKYEIIAEIIIKEKQRAIWVQPMLYFCFPINELKVNIPLVWRTAETKEFWNFIFDKNNYFIIIEMIKIFWILSPAHKYDIEKIIDIIIK